MGFNFIWTMIALLRGVAVTDAFSVVSNGNFGSEG